MWLERSQSIPGTQSFDPSPSAGSCPVSLVAEPGVQIPSLELAGEAVAAAGVPSGLMMPSCTSRLKNCSPMPGSCMCWAWITWMISPARELFPSASCRGSSRSSQIAGDCPCSVAASRAFLSSSSRSVLDSVDLGQVDAFRFLFPGDNLRGGHDNSPGISQETTAGVDSRQLFQ